MEWKNDTTSLDKINAHGYKWLMQGFIVDVFCPDFSKRSNVIGVEDSEVYRRYTGIAKVLSVSPHNPAPLNEVKVGDIMYVGDDLTNMAKNHAYNEWFNTPTNARREKVPPPEFIRKMHRWMEGGMLYLINRGDVVAERRGLEMTPQKISTVTEPTIFRIPPMDALALIKGDPWA